MQENKQQHSVVIGGGIVGVCCALFLQRDGHVVTLIDPAEAGESTAKWSCGQMAVSEIIPLSKKGTLKQIPKWLMEKEGPLDLHLQALPSMLPWFVRFILCARDHRIEHIAETLATLTHKVYSDYALLLSGLNTQWIGQAPTIEVFDQLHDLHDEQPYIHLRRQLGFKLQTLTGDDISDLEPAIAGKFQHGILLDDWTTVKDTKGIIVALTERFLAQGGQRLQTRVNELLGDERRISHVRLATGKMLSTDSIVLAAGMGCRPFFEQLGIKAPLKAIGGYQTLLPNPNVELKHAIMYFNGGFGLIPLDSGLQIGGGIEFAREHSAPNFKRAIAILQRAKTILPELDISNEQFGVGYRPFLPDTKPVIDLAPNHRNVALAFGHGQLGLTLGATTGRLVANLLAERPSDVDLTPFGALRF